MTWGMVGAAAVSVVGGVIASKKSGSSATPQTSTQQQQVDPRIESMLFGSSGTRQLKSGAEPIDYGDRGNPIYAASDYETVGGKQGLLDQYQSLLNTPQSAGLDFVGRHSNDFISAYGEGINKSLMSGANKLMQGNAAPQMASQNGVPFNSSKGSSFRPSDNMSSSNINAPSQNNIDLQKNYDKFLNDNASLNPYLSSAIQAGINQGADAFKNMTTEATQNLLENIMPNIRGGAIASGQYGGSRQGVLEAKAVQDLSKQLANAAGQYGDRNTSAAVGAQAQSFDSAQNRALSALQGLSGNQYNVAGQNAGFNHQNNQYYSGLDQNNQQFNAQGANQMGQYNSSLRQQANQANLQSQLGTNQLNSNMLQNGMAGLGNLFNTNYNQAQAAGNYAMNRAQQVNGLLAPYVGTNASSTNSAPMYQNNGSNALGYATLGLNAAKNVDWGNLFNGNVQPERSTYVSPSMGQTYTNNFTAPNAPNIDMKTDWNFG